MPFPHSWSELEEGELTRRGLVARLGPPTDVEGDCLIYDDLVEAQAYKFCFRGGVLVQKAAL